MPWRDNLRPASFRGAAFYVDAHDLAGGRRGPLHEYPQREEPYFEDLGRKGRVFRLTGHVLGPEYMEARDRLLQALERKGPGTLVHHYLGELTVACRDFSLRESTEEGGTAVFQIEFVETGENRQPTSQPSSRTGVRSAAAGVTGTVQSLVARALDVSGPDFLAETAAALVSDAAEALLEAAGGAGAGEALASFTRGLTGLSTSALDVVRDPAAFATEYLGLSETFGALAADGMITLRAAERLARFGEDLSAPPLTTATRLQQQRNQSAIVTLVRVSAVAEAARAGTRMNFDSYQDAAAVRGRLTGLLDAEIERAGASGEDDIFQALQGLYAAVVRDITRRGASLAPLVSFQPQATLPAVVVAHLIYGDAARADEIVARNRIRHPGFVPGGTPLEVLASG